VPPSRSGVQSGRGCGGNTNQGKMMLELERPGDLAQYVGKEIGVSDWFTVDQAIIDKFADATGDHQWIHVDVERAKREMPGGKTIAHGYLTLSLVPRLGQTIYRVKRRSRGLNYGSNRIRFTGQVPAGSRIRLRQKIKSVEPVEGGVRITSESSVEVEGAARPALVAEIISMQFD
jgi:acyl dehydratase